MLNGFVEDGLKIGSRLLYPVLRVTQCEIVHIWARAFDPQTKEFVRFLVTTPQNLKEDSLYAKERALVADIWEELRQGRRCQVYATYTGEKDVTLRLETVLRQARGCNRSTPTKT